MNKEVELKHLAVRLKSFKNWKSPTQFVSLAAAGFRFTGVGDRVQCDFCGTRVVQWTTSDDPLQCHARLSPNCKFLASIGYIPSQNLAKYVHYTTYSDRLASLSEVTTEFIQHLPPFEKIAEAGFFFLGSIDRMGCYHCGLILRDWEATTDPIGVHRQFRGTCHYIITLCQMKQALTSEDSSTGAVTDTYKLVNSVENHRATIHNKETFTGRIGTMIQQLPASKPKVACTTILSNSIAAKPIENRHCRSLSKLPPLDTPSYSIEVTDGGDKHNQPMYRDINILSTHKQATSSSTLNINNTQSQLPVQTNLTTVGHPLNNYTVDCTKSKQKPTTNDGSQIDDSVDPPTFDNLDTRQDMLHQHRKSLAVTESVIMDPRALPPTYHNVNFLELPMVKAVMEFEGVSYDKVVNTVRLRYLAHGDYFSSADALLAGIIENESM